LLYYLHRKMGAAFGSISDTCLDYTLIESGKYEIRSYNSYYVAELDCGDENLKDAFAAMLRYVGADCVPENVRGTVSALQMLISVS
jgi:hypothetical protein